MVALVTAALAAVLACLPGHGAGSHPLTHIAADVDEVFIVGDLHGDLQCAKEWVRRSGLIDLATHPWNWTGRRRQALVFLGDYVDKGPYGRQVLEFVRNLTEAFPDQVLAMLGNHDLYMLMDSLWSDGATQLMGRPVRDFAYAFTHPEEYLNWVPVYDTRENDTSVVLPALLDALEFVYARRAEQKVLLGPSPSTSHADLFDVAPLFQADPALADGVRSRLLEWQQHLAQGLVSSGLAEWLAARPLVSVVGGALFVHGGVPYELLSKLQQSSEAGEAGSSGLAAALEAATTGSFRKLWDGRSSEAMAVHGKWGDFTDDPLHSHLIDEVVNHRGYHRSCREVRAVLDALHGELGVEVIVVGHTPGDSVRISCGGRLAAVDSSLSRYFRANGNLYCSSLGEAAPGMACVSVSGTCSGQASRLIREGTAWVVHPVELEVGAQGQEHFTAQRPPLTTMLMAAFVAVLLFALLSAVGGDGTEVDEKRD